MEDIAMWLFVWLALGFQEPEVVRMEVRDYYHVFLAGTSTVGGSRRVIALMDSDDYNRKKNTVYVCLDDIGYVAPIGCVIEVRGTKRKLNTTYGEREGLVVTRREDLKVLGLAPVQIPELTLRDLSEKKAMESREKALRLPQNAMQKPAARIPATKKKTGIELPGGKP